MLEQMARQGTARYRDRVNDQVQRMDAFRVDWPLANDYAGSHYRGREAVAVELVQVVRFPMAGFDAAMDSVRFWCSIPQSHHEWNAERASFFGAADSLRASVLYQKSLRSGLRCGRLPRGLSRDLRGRLATP